MFKKALVLRFFGGQSKDLSISCALFLVFFSELPQEPGLCALFLVFFSELPQEPGFHGLYGPFQ